MLICKNCNKEYTQSLKFCSFCGSELVEKRESTPSEAAGVLSVAVGANEYSEKAESIVENPINEKKCNNCGATIIDGEKFCIKCGTPANANDAPALVNNEGVKPSEVKAVFSRKDRLQEDLTAAFRSNKFFDLFWKYAIVFALYYPIYLLMARIDGLSGLVEVLDYISIFGFYAYYIGLVALWSKKSYLPMLIAFAIRFLNSFILLFQSEVPISSICRSAVLVTTFVFVFKDFRTTGQYQNIKRSFDTKTCPACGASVKANDKFCQKCGRKMEG